MPASFQKPSTSSPSPLSRKNALASTSGPPPIAHYTHQHRSAADEPSLFDTDVRSRASPRSRCSFAFPPPISSFHHGQSYFTALLTQRLHTRAAAVRAALSARERHRAWRRRHSCGTHDSQAAPHFICTSLPSLVEEGRSSLVSFSRPATSAYGAAALLTSPRAVVCVVARSARCAASALGHRIRLLDHSLTALPVVCLRVAVGVGVLCAAVV